MVEQQKQQRKIIEVGVCKTINVQHTKPSKFNVREEADRKESDEFIELCDSIKANGLIEPLVVRTDGNSGYEVIAGSRRLAAMKHLGISEAPAVVRKNMDDNDVRIASLVENIHRKGLSDEEKAQAILSAYKAEGRWAVDQIVSWLDHLDKFMDEYESGTINLLKEEQIGKPGSQIRINPDEKFISLCHRISYSPNWQSRLLRNLQEFKNAQTRKAVERAGLNKGKSNKNKKSNKPTAEQKKKDLLKHPLLQQYPAIQQMLAQQIAKLSYPKSKIKVDQAIHDLQTGALEVNKKSGRVEEDASKREEVEKTDEQTKTESTSPTLAREEINDLADKMFLLLTGQNHPGKFEEAMKIARSKEAEQNMISVAKLSLAPREQAALQIQVTPLAEALNRLVEILYREAEDSEKNKELYKP